jgi:hypothetical protein
LRASPGEIVTTASRKPVERLTPPLSASIVLGVVKGRLINGHKKFGHRMIPRR